MKALKQLLVVVLFSLLSINSIYAATKNKTHIISHKINKKLHLKKHGVIANRNTKLASNHKHHIKKHSYMLGIASFYGDKDGFNGRKMANGHTFWANDIYSAAHPTLPLGTKLMVTNLTNGRSLYVEVRDRMPRGKRIIDLSNAAAKFLGMHRKGLAQVQLVKVSNDVFEKNRRYLEVDDDDNGTPG